MTEVVLDTNVLISFITDRNAEQQARAATLFETATAGELRLILHQAVISETVFVLGNLYELKAERISEILRKLLDSPGVTVVDEVHWKHVLEFWPQRFPDFADALLASVSQQGQYDAIATFDQRFIRRLRRDGLGSYWSG